MLWSHLHEENEVGQYRKDMVAIVMCADFADWGQSGCLLRLSPASQLCQILLSTFSYRGEVRGHTAKDLSGSRNEQSGCPNPARPDASQPVKKS